jgi:hypothetical protein
MSKKESEARRELEPHEVEDENHEISESNPEVILAITFIGGGTVKVHMPKSGAHEAIRNFRNGYYADKIFGDKQETFSIVGQIIGSMMLLEPVIEEGPTESRPKPINA